MPNESVPFFSFHSLKRAPLTLRNETYREIKGYRLISVKDAELFI